MSPWTGKIKRMGMAIGLNTEKVEKNKKLHATVWPEILAKITECNIRNYSIFLNEPESLLFNYREYNGDDFSVDAKKWLTMKQHNSGGNYLYHVRSLSIPVKKANGGR